MLSQVFQQIKEKYNKQLRSMPYVPTIGNINNRKSAKKINILTTKPELVKLRDA